MKKHALLNDFENILSRWGQVLAQTPGDVVRDSAILRFELTFEVAWKVVQLSVREHGFESHSSRHAFRISLHLCWVTHAAFS